MELGSKLIPEGVLDRMGDDDDRVRELVGVNAGSRPEASRDRFSEEEEFVRHGDIGAIDCPEEVLSGVLARKALKDLERVLPDGCLQGVDAT
eukprot:2849055-Alexandrium_andersonii.AAC.1